MSGLRRRSTVPDAGAAREPLIDINVESPSSDVPAAEIPGRRRRLSDVRNPDDNPQPEPRSTRPHLSRTPASDRENPVSEPQAVSGGPGLVDLDPPAPAAAPKGRRKICKKQEDDEAIASIAPAPVEQEPARGQVAHGFRIAVAGGGLAAVVGALVWATVAAATHVAVPWMAIAAGILVGGTVRNLGRGSDRSFGWLGAGLSLSACLLGNCLGNFAFIARDAGVSMTSLLGKIGVGMLPRLVTATLHPLDIPLYALALYLGYRLSFRKTRPA